YDYLFNDPDPDGPGKNFMDAINPDSLTVLKGCKIESTIRDVQMPTANQNSLTYQFIRNGYFCLDNVDSRPDALVFNRSVALKDSFKR
nr:glutamine--tRNA ligase [Lachnospiraceae bacterium]